MPAFYQPNPIYRYWAETGTSASTTPVSSWITGSGTNTCTTSTTTTIITIQGVASWYYNQTAGVWYSPEEPQMISDWRDREEVYSPAIARQHNMLRESALALAAQRDQEAYQRAISEHDAQEADRIAKVIAARQRNEERYRQEQAARQEALAAQQLQQEAAKLRANEFLLEHLTPEQRETFKHNGWFIVEGGRSKTKYRIRAIDSLVANVDVLGRKDAVAHRLCAHVPRQHKVPLGDQLLAQKMMLEFSEDDFLRVANRH